MKTMNYEQFKLVKSNRPVVANHVKTLMESIKKHGYFNSKPITVNACMEISDGQHRFYACRELGIPVLYEIDSVNVNDSMIILNSTSNIWRLDEYINHHASNGIYCYVELRNLINQSNLGTSNCISIYTGISGGISKAIRKGLELKKNTKILETIDLVDFFKGKVSFYKSTSFVRSICNMIQNKDVTQKHIDKIKLNAYSIVECAQLDQYTAQFSKLLKINLHYIK